MTKRRRLETWKEIAEYLGRGVRTAQRWEKKDGLTVHREAGGKKESVFAWSDEIDAWREGYPDINGPTAISSDRAVNEGPDHSHKPGEFNKKKRRLKSLLVLVFLSLTGLLLLTAGYFFFQSRRETTEDMLFFRFTEFDRGSCVDIYNANNVRIQSFHSGVYSFKKCMHSYKNELRNLKFIDVNTDGLLDIVYADLTYSPQNKLSIYLRQDMDNVSLLRSWELDELFEYEGETFGEFSCEQIICEDLNEDGAPEIVVGLNSHPNYPSLCRVFDVQGNVIASIFHPGRFRNLESFDRDGNGFKEIYVAATNNFLDEEFSAPVMYVVENEWVRLNQLLSFFGESRSLASTVVSHFREIYVNFKADHILPMEKTWESAFMGYFNPHNLPLIFVQASPFKNVNKDGSSKSDHFRTFFFDRMMNCVQSYIHQEHVSKYNINVESKEVQDLLRPVYWNGAFWQEEVCYIPQGPSSDSQ